MKNIFILTITIGFIVCFLFTWYFLLPIYLIDLGASDKTINIAYFIFNITFYIGQIPGGILSDRFGRKPVIVITTLLYALSGYGMHQSSSWLEALIFYTIGSLSSSIQLPAIYAMIFESQKQKGLSFSMTSFSYNLGLALGPLLGALLIEKTNLKGLLLIYSIIAFLISIIRLLFLEETLNAKNLKPKEKINFDKSFFILMIGGIFFFLSVTLTINGPYTSLYLKEGLNLSEKEVNLVFTKTGITTALTCLILGKIIDHVNTAKAWAIASLLHPLLLLFWVSLRNSTILLILSVIFAEIAYIAYPILVSKAFPENLRGRGLGLFGFVTGSVGSLSPLFLNVFNKDTSFLLPFILATIFGILSFWIIIRVGGDLKDEH